MVVSNLFCFHPYLGKIPILTNIFSDGLKPSTRNLPWEMFFNVFLMMLKLLNRDTVDDFFVRFVSNVCLA